MKDILIVWKPEGVTPFEMVQNIKHDKVYSQEKIGYAGRLDPMAEGIMILLVGEKNKQRKKFEKLNKKYTFSVLYGISTDTYDLLGMPKIHPEVDNNNLNFNLTVGRFVQPYPPYSYIKVDGHPLFYWARKGLICEKKIPSKVVEIKSTMILAQRTISSKYLKQSIKKRVSRVYGDFRQQEILSAWKKVLSKNRNFTVVDYEIECTSGTYIRGIANELGRINKTGAIALKIRRDKVGIYSKMNYEVKTRAEK